MLRRWRDRASSGPDRALPGQDLAVPVRVPDERILEIAGQKLGEMGGEWVLGPGPLLAPEVTVVQASRPCDRSLAAAAFALACGLSS